MKHQVVTLTTSSTPWSKIQTAKCSSRCLTSHRRTTRFVIGTTAGTAFGAIVYPNGSKHRVDRPGLFVPRLVQHSVSALQAAKTWHATMIDYHPRLEQG